MRSLGLRLLIFALFGLIWFEMARAGEMAGKSADISSERISRDRISNENVDAHETCPPGSVQVSQEQGLVTGCERHDKNGSPVRVGQWQWRDSAQKLVLSASYNDWGAEDGIATQYGEDGQILSKRSFSDGKLSGDSTVWWSGGHLREQAQYLSGKVHGIRRSWTYSPMRKDCSRGDESCWVGSQECWVMGERKKHSECNKLYAAQSKEGRKPASSKSVQHDQDALTHIALDGFGK